jgi:hypothetical protein
METCWPWIARSAWCPAIGLKDIVVIASGNSVLVIHKDRAQRLKEVVTRLKKNDRRDLL